MHKCNDCASIAICNNIRVTIYFSFHFSFRKIQFSVCDSILCGGIFGFRTNKSDAGSLLPKRSCQSV